VIDDCRVGAGAAGGRFGVDLREIQWVIRRRPRRRRAEPRNVHRDPRTPTGGDASTAPSAAIVDPVPMTIASRRISAGLRGRVVRLARATARATLNHVVVVRESLAEDADRIRELLRLFDESSKMTDPSAGGSFSMGMDGMRRSLEVAIAAADAQHLLARRLTVSDLVL
jgi:hypothetical protein